MLRKVLEILQTREFVSIATCSLAAKPNAAPKFFLKVEGSHIYLIDYTRSRTWDNIKANPLVSLSFMDTDNLVGYQLNGSAEVIDHGPEYDEVFKELLLKEIDLSTKRIIEGVSKGKKHNNFELSISDKISIFKVTVNEVSSIGTSGKINRQSLDI